MMMKALRIYGVNDLRLEEVPIPTITEKEILLKVEAAGICGTDLKIWKHGRANVDADHPLIMGHEVAGVIAKVGKEVPFYKEGMRITIQPNSGCAICDRCVSGNTHQCSSLRAFGVNTDGGFAEYMVVPEAAIAQGNIMLVPEGISPVVASVNEPLSCVFNGFEKCFVKPGDYAFVSGAGAIGLLHAMLLKMAGAAKIIISDLQQHRLDAAAEIIPGVITKLYGDDLKAFIMEQTGGRGVDVAICANPNPVVQREVIEYMNFGGRVNYFGLIPAEYEPVAINTNPIHSRDLIVTGNSRSSVSQFRKTMEFVGAGLLPVEKVVTHTYSIDESLQAFENAYNAVGLKHVIVF